MCHNHGTYSLFRSVCTPCRTFGTFSRSPAARAAVNACSAASSPPASSTRAAMGQPLSSSQAITPNAYTSTCGEAKGQLTMVHHGLRISRVRCLFSSRLFRLRETQRYASTPFRCTARRPPSPVPCTAGCQRRWLPTQSGRPAVARGATAAASQLCRRRRPRWRALTRRRPKRTSWQRRRVHEG
eukprot:247037-Chlamydomonas_euryale.AAC.2